MTGLFGDIPIPVPARRAVALAVAANAWGTYDYLWPEDWPQPRRGMRVRVPFGKGNRNVIGFVMDPAPAAAPDAASAPPPPAEKTSAEQSAPGRPRQLKTCLELLDPVVLLDERLWQLAAWISRYYLAPLGMVLAGMVPSSVGRYETPKESVAHLAAERADWPPALGPRQRRVLDELLEARKQGVPLLTLEQLQHHADASRDTIRRLAARGLVRLEQRPRQLDRLNETTEPDPFELNEAQQAVLAALRTKLPIADCQSPIEGEGSPRSQSAIGFSVTLLHGVTGSGKTEVYIRAIREVVAAGCQAILLVPEIALATQTLQRLARRLPRVAVLHSGLTAAQRAYYWRQIAEGHASTVIGPRSAVFAPARRLGLIIVDEEHEGSYKQDNVPRYHGRDVAIMRGRIENVHVLLGSATPSLESFHNARQGRYGLLSLAGRIRSLPMPALKLVELRKEITPGKVELIGRTLAERLAVTLDRRQQAILLMNRRGYASYVFCPSCQWRLDCEQCSRTMVFHQAIALAMCHYCQATAIVPRACPACQKKLVLFGLGIQRIESELARKFPSAAVARMDSDTMTSPAQFRKVLDAFAAGAIDILLGTQMVAKGLDFPRVTLVGVVSADTALAIPDFRAGERTFQLIVQVAGRAGRSDLPGEVVVQTWYPDDPAIRFALTHDYAGFSQYELLQREQTQMPPFSRMVRFVLRGAVATRTAEAAQGMADHLRKVFQADRDVRIIGPMQAGVFKIRNQFRFQIICACPRAGLIQSRLAADLPRLAGTLGAEIVVDADPMNLM